MVSCRLAVKVRLLKITYITAFIGKNIYNLYLPNKYANGYSKTAYYGINFSL